MSRESPSPASGAPPTNLQIFDLHVEIGARSTRDLANLAFFGTSRAVLCGGGFGVRPPGAREVLERFERALTVEVGRLRAVGVTPYVALGMEAQAVPRRGVREVLGALPSYLRRAPVVALGPVSLGVSPREAEALIAQLKLAASLDLPCLVTLPPRGKLRVIARILALASEVGLSSQRIAFDHADARALRRVRAAKAWGILTVHPDHLRPEAAVKILLRDGASQVLFDSVLGSGPADVLALPKVALQLGKSGLPPEVIHCAMYQNALTFLNLS